MMRILRTTGVAACLIAAGISIGAGVSTLASIYDWSTTPSANDTADPGINWAEGMLPSSVNDSARATMAAVAAWRQDQAAVPALGGSGNAFTITGTQAMRSWTPGLFAFKATRSNTGAVTFSRDGLAAKPLRLVSGSDLFATQIQIGAIYLVTYSAATDEVLIVNRPIIANNDLGQMPASSVKANVSGGAAIPGDVSLAAFFAAAPAASIPPAAINVQGYSGQVIWMNSGSCPSGWIAADGSSGSPDLRGAFVRGMDNGRGLDPARTLASFQSDAFASHTHSLTDPGHTHTINEAVGANATGALNQIPNGAGSPVASTNSSTTGITIAATGGAETRPKNVALLACYHV